MESHRNISRDDIDDEDEEAMHDREDNESENIDDIEGSNRMETSQENNSNNLNSNSESDDKNTNADGGGAPDNKKRLDCLANMSKIEKEFSDLRDKLFEEKLQALKKEYEQVQKDGHPEQLKKIQELEQQKISKITSSDLWKQYQLNNINSMYEAEKRQAEDEFKSEKEELKRRLLNEIIDKQRKLEEEKSSMSLEDGSETRSNFTRKLRRRAYEPTPTAASANQLRKKHTPQINYTLKESEIMEDLYSIRRGLTTHRGNGKSSSRYYTPVLS